MKLFINISSIVIMILSLSSITSAQGTQQRPSQRSFAAVISKIMEKKKGRDRNTEELKREVPRLEGKKDPEDYSPKPNAVILRSRQKMQTPPVKKRN